MKQVKSLILAALLVCALSAGVQAGDMGSPGAKTRTTCEKACPNPETAISTDTSSLGATATDSSSSDLSPVVIELLLALLTLV